jgi:hypothetical protein
MLNISDPRWQKIDSRLLHGVFDGKKIGVVFATCSNQNFPDTYALNVAEYERVKAGKDGGKIAEAYVVAVEMNGGERIYKGEMTIADATPG